ncbi:MAG: inositol monophosphatase [Candidatus Delongbacteria bacterium]|nr:inositol monophosphatase [Candidatus Delongbacteria bacterium]
MVEIQSLTNISVKAARSAGRIMLEGGEYSVSMKSPSDFVTDIDIECQNTIKEIISGSFPTHNFLAEEDGGSFKDTDDLWIIDPLDGTTNFIHGLSHSAVSIAFYTNGAVQTGVIYDPYKDELFHAVKGHGAYLNGKSISVSGTSDMKQSLIATGMPFRRHEKIPEYFKVLSEVLKKSSGIRRMGSAALDLAYTACGRFDGFFEGWLSPWDVAAGILLVEEAGGKVRDFSGNNDFLNNGCIIASGKGILDQLFETVNKVMKDEN